MVGTDGNYQGPLETANRLNNVTRFLTPIQTVMAYDMQRFITSKERFTANSNIKTSEQSLGLDTEHRGERFVQCFHYYTFRY